MFTFADKNNIFEGYEYDAQCLVQQYFSYNVAVSLGQTLSHNVVSSTPRLSEIRTQNISGDKH
jgi:hypothetical protein